MTIIHQNLLLIGGLLNVCPSQLPNAKYPALKVHRRKTFNKTLFIGLFIQILFIHATMAQRDPLKWPFSEKSIWNMPIGSGTVYIHAHIEKAMQAGMTIDEDYPASELVTIVTKGQHYQDISVFDAVGQLAFRKTLEPDSEIMTLDIKGWNKGIYFIRLHHKSRLSSSKLIIE